MTDALTKSDIAVSVAETDDTTFVVGECVLIRTVTYHLIGRVTRTSVCHGVPFVHLEDASWLAESDRFHVTLEQGSVKELEPAKKPIRVNVQTIVDVYHWDHPLPRTPK